MDKRNVYRAALSLIVLAALAGAVWIVVAPGPSPGVEITPADSGASPAPGTGSGGAANGEAAEPVNINTASADELTALPGVGEVIAARIVAYRRENGPFERIDQIMEVRGIGAKTHEKLRPLITVGN